VIARGLRMWWRDLTSERHTCPRRMDVLVDADRWHRGRWNTKLERAWDEFWHGGRFSAGWQLLYWLYTHGVVRDLPWTGGLVWEWPWQPRVCTFCGGVHPADAVRLRREGWRVVGSTKLGVRYLHPPGSWFPTPAVKVVLAHASTAQFPLILLPGSRRRAEHPPLAPVPRPLDADDVAGVPV